MGTQTFTVKLGVPQTITLTEAGGAGYLWDLSPLTSAGVAVLDDKRILDDEGVGGFPERSLTLQSDTAQTVTIRQVRPWLGPQDGDKTATIVFDA